MVFRFCSSPSQPALPGYRRRERPELKKLVSHMGWTDAILEKDSRIKK